MVGIICVVCSTGENEGLLEDPVLELDVGTGACVCIKSTNKEGSFVKVAVGESDTTNVGLEEGFQLGRVLGLNEGTSDGSKEGTSDGLKEGKLDGIDVG